MRIGEDDVGPLVADELLPRLLDEQVGTTYRLRLAKRGRALQVLLEPPLADDEKGPFAQEVLRAAYAEPGPVDPASVYLECYGGRSATDSQLAIAEELLRTRPDLRLHWGVADHSVVLPDGVEPVVVNSRRWHEVRGTAAYLVANTDFDRHFRKRPGQRLLQTFHGYPSKSMGLSMWRGKQLTERRLATDLARTSGTWDLILTPAPEMDAYYREEYAYAGPILHHGYPRDDVLVGPAADATRQVTRERLGITDDQTVVLHAPTFRDDLATSWSSAGSVEHWDLERASAELGEGFVILARGHRFHAPVSARVTGGARVLDVTDHPEVNDLILAADAAVLDYSSLRFDFALTRRPMLFLVPDLAAYSGAVRGFLYPYVDTAPGPLLRTGDDVTRQLRDLGGVGTQHAEAYAAFDARFNAFQDGHSAERVVAAFFGPTDEEPVR